MRAAYGAAILQRLARAVKNLFFFFFSEILTIEGVYVPIDGAHDIFYNDRDRQKKYDLLELPG